MRTIFKYKVSPGGHAGTELSIPLDGKVLSVGLDPLDDICVWAEVDTDLPTLDVQIICVGTGIPTPRPEGRFLGSVLDRGTYVWHFYVAGDE